VSAVKSKAPGGRLAHPVPVLALDGYGVAFAAADQGEADRGHREGLGQALDLEPQTFFVGGTS
jgi:hypothetical protein